MATNSNFPILVKAEVKARTENLFSIKPQYKRTPAVLSENIDINFVHTKKERDESISRTSKKQGELPLLTVTSSAISLYSFKDMKRIAGNILITRTSIEGTGSVTDPRMGVLNPNISCRYCSQIDCPGHYGLIEFGKQIYNPAFIRKLVSILTCVCNDCGGLLIPEDVINLKGFNRLHYDKKLGEMEKHCKGLSCIKEKNRIDVGETINCSKNPKFITTDIKDKGVISYKIDGNGNNPATGTLPMSIDKVSVILSNISPFDCYLLGFPCFHRQFKKEVNLKILGRASKEVLARYKLETFENMMYENIIEILDSLRSFSLIELGFNEGSHPKNIIMEGILVPPLISRPPIFEGGSKHEDQITHEYKNIVSKSQNGTSEQIYIAVKELVFKTEGKKIGNKEYLSIIERIQGKEAIIRKLLMGKRCDFCARTVAGPDPSLKFGQVRIPQYWESILTKTITVTNFNIVELTNMLQTGRITHIIQKQNGQRKYYNKGGKLTLRIGDKIERYLQNGDRVSVNRQPTLHRQSMMSYEVVLGYQLTVGLHLSYTSPMNCDFDGDENNVWNPQDFEVEAEAEILMNVKTNIMSTEQNRPIMGLVMNSISGVYLLTEPSVIIEDKLFNELIGLISEKSGFDTLHFRLKKYGVNPRSGKAIFSAMLPDTFYYNYKGVLIIEGILVKGRLRKTHVGASHRSIIQELYKNYSLEVTAAFFTNAPWVINKWLVERGFTVGMRDIINLEVVDGVEQDKNKRILDQELSSLYVKLEALGGKLTDPIEELFRKKQINNLVNVAQGIGLRLAKEVLSKDNSIGVMTELGAGTKGGIANIGQMMGSVGQQNYHGDRLKATLAGGKRLLPTYDEYDNNPEAHGFISESFFTGLTPEGLFFLQAGGREGLLDTALKTAETGSMQHRMIKAFENVVIGYDGSIRNTIGTLFSPVYNSGYDIGEMMSVKTDNKQNIPSFIDIESLVSELNIERGWVPKDVDDIISKNKEEIIPDDYKNDDILEMVKPNHVISPAVTDTKITYDINEDVENSRIDIKITKFEKARIIGTRSMQLSNNAEPLVDIGTETDVVKIALMEYNMGLLQLYIVRKYPDGSYYKFYPTLDNINYKYKK